MSEQWRAFQSLKSLERIEGRVSCTECWLVPHVASFVTVAEIKLNLAFNVSDLTPPLQPFDRRPCSLIETKTKIQG
jgi:hypothetical protein